MSVDNVDFASRSGPKRAEEMGLVARDFRGVEPSGEKGFTVADLDEVLRRKQERAGYRTTRWRPGGEDDPGHPNYECLNCGFAHLDETVVKAHVANTHR